MALPDPDYLALKYVGWNGLQTDCVLVGTDGTANIMFIWKEVLGGDKRVLHDLIMAYALQNSLLEANALTLTVAAAFQQVKFTTGKVVGSLTGLANGTTIYTANVNIDTVDYPLSVTGSAAQDYTALLVVINAAIGVNGTASMVDGKLSIESATADSTSNVTITDVDLFKSLTDYNSILTFAGVDALRDIFDLNLIHNNPYSTKYNGLLHTIAAAPGKNNGPLDKNHVYFDHAAAVWKYSYNDVAVP